MAYIKMDYKRNGIQEEWNYYRDGNSWLGKILFDMYPDV